MPDDVDDHRPPEYSFCLPDTGSHRRSITIIANLVIIITYHYGYIHLKKKKKKEEEKERTETMKKGDRGLNRGTYIDTRR